MRSQKIFYFSTTFAAFFMAVFAVGSIQQSIDTKEIDNTNEPTVVSTSPSDGEMDVARNTVIEITFSEEMDSTSMKNSTFTLMQGTESVAGTIEYSGNKAMFTTTNGLKAQSEYTANITTSSNQSDDDYLNERSNNEEFNEDEFNEEESDYRNTSENGMKWSFTTGGNSDPVETVDLGSAAGYVILAHSSIQNDSTSEITGEKGFNPNFKSSKDNKTAYWLKNEDVDKEAVRKANEMEAMRRDTTREKNENRNDSVNEVDSNANNLDEALEDMMTAYTDASERLPVDFVDYKFLNSDDKADSTGDNYSVDDDKTDFGWERDFNAEETMNNNTADTSNTIDNENSNTLEPGIYKWNDSVVISSNITLSGNADDVWIFQISEGLTVGRDVNITLSDGADAKHVFWQVAGEVNLEESSHFEGIILSLTGITMKNGASLNGRMLAQTDVSLDDNTITEPKILTTVQATSINE